MSRLLPDTPLHPTTVILGVRGWTKLTEERAAVGERGCR